MDGLQAVAGTANPKRSADLVFVHGLGGGSRTTWMREPKDDATFWPAWLAADFASSLGVWTLGYAADVSAWQRESMPLADRGNAVLEQLVNERLGERALIFVAHSLGGILVKQILNAAESQGVPRWQRIAQATRGIAFIATPHSGANIASFASFVGSVLRPNEPVEALRAHEPHLRELHGWFLNTYLQRHPVVCRTYCERRELRPELFLGLKLPKGIVVVDATSAEPNIRGERAIPLDEDHSSICKPVDRNAPLCKSIWAFVAECLAPPPVAPPDSAARPGAVSGAGLVGVGGQGMAYAAIADPDLAAAAAWRPQAQPATAYDPLRGDASKLFDVNASPASLLRLAKPKPQIDELFEIVTDPDEVPKALFRTESGRGWVPYEVEFVRGRVGLADAQQALADALLDSGGRLLLAGRGGIGKTRETAELAADLCARGWTVAVARPDADARLGPLAPIPGALHDARLLLIVDNLHARVRSDDDEAAPYAERLGQCIASLARQGLDDLRVIAITRDEPRFEKGLGLAAGADRWGEFALFRLPDLTTESLTALFAALVERARLVLDAATLERLVANSDRTPRTLFINVDLSRRRGTPLGERWLPTEGESWREKSRAVQARHPESEAVQASLRLLTGLGLPPRFAYVQGIGPASGIETRRKTLEALIDEGLVGRRRDELTLFAPPPDPAPEATEQPLQAAWDAVVGALTAPPANPPEWLDDLALLAFALLHGERPAQAIAVATLAIDHGAGGAAVYRARAGAHFLSNAREAARRDIDAAIARDPQEASSWFLRGLLSYLDNNGDGVLADMAKARELGHEASIIDMQCGMVHYQRQQWREAEAALGRAIERDGGQADAMLFFVRAAARQQLGDLAAAATDFDIALERPSNTQAALELLPAFEAKDSADLFSALRAELPRGHEHAAFVYPARAFVRARLGRFAEAEQDYDAAIRLDFAAVVDRISRAFEATALPAMAQARNALRTMSAQLGGDAALYAGRGVMRRNLGRFDDALADFASALARGADPAPVLVERAVLHLACARYDEAAADCEAALADPAAAAAAHSLHGLARQGQERLAEAEADFDVSIRLGRDDALVYVWRSAMRIRRGDYAAAMADLDCALARPEPPASAWLMRASIRVELGEAVAAEQDADEALVRGADAAAAHALRGAARLMLERLADAELDLCRAIELGREDALVYRWRGIARTRLERPDALGDLDAAVARGDTAAATYFWRGCARLDADAPGPAEADFDLALAGGIDPPSVQLLRGVARLRLGRPAEARADLDAVIEGGRIDVLGLSSRADARRALGDAAGAADDLRRAIALAPQDPALPGRLVTVLRGLERNGEALRLLDDMLERAPDRLDARWQRAEMHLIAGRFDAAEADYDKLIEHHPDDADVRAKRSTARYGRGDAAGAIADLDVAVAQAPANPLPLADRADAWLLLGRLDAAERDIAAVVALAPASAPAHGLPALLALARGDAEAASRGFEQAEAVDRSGNWTLRRGLALLLCGQVGEAQAVYAQGLADACPGDARLARLELDHWLAKSGKAFDADAVDLVRGRIDAAIHAGMVDDTDRG